MSRDSQAPVFENVTLFKKGKAFRDLLFQKLLNGERAAYAAPTLCKSRRKIFLVFFNIVAFCSEKDAEYSWRVVGRLHWTDQEAEMKRSENYFEF
jgi:hypothetical protein